MNPIAEPMSAVSSPIDKLAAPPACFALDAILKIDDHLRLAGRIDAHLIHMRGANMPEPLLNHGVLFGQGSRPEQMYVGALIGLIDQFGQSRIPLLLRGLKQRSQI